MTSRLRDRDLWDVLAALVLDALVTLGWWTTFAGSGWWVASLVTALLAACVVVVVRDTGSNPVIVPGVLLLVYVVVAGPLAAGAFEVRGTATFTDGLVATGEVWGDLLSTHPPADSTGAFLIPPVLLSVLVAGLASTLALWTTRPAAPLVPVGLGLAGVLLLGRHETASALLLGIGVAVVSVLWVRLRAGRVDEGRFGLDPVRTRGLVLGLVVLLAGSAAAAGVVGEAGEDRYVLRDEVDGLDPGAITTPLDDFRDFTPQPAGTTGNVVGERLLVVDGLAPGSRLRFAALDTYDGRRWKAAPRTDPLRDDDAFLHVSSGIDNPATGAELEVEITATRFWNRPWVPTVGAVQGFTFDGGDALRSDLLYNPATQTALLPDGLPAGVTYSFRARNTDLVASPDLEPSDALDEEFRDTLTDVGILIIAWNEGATTSMAYLFDLLDRLRREGRFSHGTEPWERQYRAGHGYNRVTDDFLFKTPSVGDQEQYAAAAALLATRRGIPARVVVGAVVPRDGVVRGHDVTSWIEVRVADGTWRTIPTRVFMGRRPPDRSGLPPAVRDLPDLPPTDSLEDQLDAAEDVDDLAEGDEPGASGGNGGASGTLALLLLVLVPLVPPSLKWRRRRRRLRARRVSTRYAGAWDELVDGARDLGLPVRTATTRPAQAAALDRAADLALRADRRIFSDAELDAAEAAEFWSLVRAELGALAGARPRWRRWWAVVNPRSLWGH